MWQTFIFGMHWRHGGKMYYDELPAGSKEEAAEYFIDHMRDDIALVRVELVGPDEPGVREYAHSPVSPFSPLKARRRLDRSEEHTSELQSHSDLVCRLLLEKKK